MLRIAKTNFPSRIVVKGRVYYLNVPAAVIERMGLKEGEYVDVRISLPETKKSDSIGTETEEN